MSGLAIKLQWPVIRERAIPALGALLLVPGATGVLGNSVYETQTVSGLHLELTYAPLVYLNQETVWGVDITATLRANGQYSLRVSETDLEHFMISRVVPKPLEVRNERYDRVYVFSGADGNHVDFYLIPRDVGKTPATLRYGVDAPISYQITTLP